MRTSSGSSKISFFFFELRALDVVFFLLLEGGMMVIEGWVAGLISRWLHRKTYSVLDDVA